ncbi:YvrJ family protein [Priestia aryabhattai]|uniref:YvrJ family protein n=1 Tax=Priestia aryabhattai TaxID=412384 RepID=UPI001C8D1266|nr:YvrJ family protein [Priestia aryabhattai]MBY0065222.1 YvrJ family protein [Priestia aryabhattai]
MVDTFLNLSVESVVTLIESFGFPIVLSIYLLIRFEKKIENLTVAIDELQETIQRK